MGKRPRVSYNHNKKEEISDMIEPAAYDDKENFKRGLVLKFAKATIRITKVDRKNKRTWGEHVSLVDQKFIGQHHEHDIDRSKEAYKEYGMPFCNDCNVKLDEPSTEDGDKKALDRKEEKDKEWDV